MLLCNWFNRSGALVRRRLLREYLFLDAFGRLIAYYWDILYLALRAATHIGRARPRQAEPIAVVDPWFEEDARI